MIAKVFSSFVKGQAAMLDDRAKLIEHMGFGADYDIEYQLSLKATEDAKRNTDTEPIEGEHATGMPRLCFNTLLLLGILLIRIGSVIFVCCINWIFSGFIGQTLLGIPGLLGSFVGLFSLIGVLTFGVILTYRWNNAKTDASARQGSREIGALIEMFNTIHFCHQCPSCGFSLSDLPPEPDGCTLCPECNGAWNRSWWASFVPAVTLGKLAKKSEGKRSRRCLNDARTAEFEVAAWLPRKERKELFRLAGSCLLWRDSVALLFILFLFLTIWVFLTFSANNWFWTTVILFPFLGGLYPVYRFTSGFRQRQQFVRDQIDLRRCAQCDHKLDDTPHPIDGALCCPQCRHAWDPDTANKKHHARKRFKPNEHRHGFPESVIASSED